MLFAASQILPQMVVLNRMTRTLQPGLEAKTVNCEDRRVIIIGGGPAGLTAAYELSKRAVPAVVLEADSVVGGIARTVNYKGYLFDIGGHRFYTKWNEVQQIWEEVLGDGFLLRPRLSRIYYRKKFFPYPLVAKDALFGLGPVEAVGILASYLRAQIFPSPTEENLEQWICNRFGRRLYRNFFKAYTEKVWGVPCTEIHAEWAARRIRGLSLSTVVRSALWKNAAPEVKTLINEFHYPQRGPGQMWETLAGQLQERECPVLTEHRVVRIQHRGGKVTGCVTAGPWGEKHFAGTDFISSMPLRELVDALEEPAPEEVRRAASRLRYRDFLIVSLIINRKDVVPDNWIYVHDPSVKVGRIQNFKNWSPAMVPDANKTSLGMEYFVFQNDELWSSSDDQLIDLARKEIAQLGLVRPQEVEDGTVVRMPKAYPSYQESYAEQVEVIRSYVEQNLTNLQLVGRNGMHKYNNQDHSMMTALGAARNILGAHYDLWAINTEPDYQEEKRVAKSDPQPASSFAEPPRVGAQASPAILERTPLRDTGSGDDT
jgi:protoporphyrinogen oxidase